MGASVGAAPITYSYIGAPQVCEDDDCGEDALGHRFEGSITVDDRIFSQGDLRNSTFAFDSFQTENGYEIRYIFTNAHDSITGVLEGVEDLRVEEHGIDVSGMFEEFLFGSGEGGEVRFSIGPDLQPSGSYGEAENYGHSNRVEGSENGTVSAGFGEWVRSGTPYMRSMPVPAALGGVLLAVAALLWMGRAKKR
ncbi:hypothetical protein ACMA5I_04875 [Paracoccaceae bacterium GXU_MW_L88]